MTNSTGDEEVPADNSLALSSELGELLLDKRWTITTAESCTGGLVAGAITDVAGSSNWFRQGIVSYANTAKSALLGVDPSLLESQGAVSEAVVLAMAEGARAQAAADVAVSVSGVAGPGGGSVDKPVGLVWFAWAVPALGLQAECCRFEGGRLAVRQLAVLKALRGTILRVKSSL